MLSIVTGSVPVLMSPDADAKCRRRRSPSALYTDGAAIDKLASNHRDDSPLLSLPLINSVSRRK